MTASIVYEGMLRCRAEHIQSRSVIETDAPSDNKGKGERFSPTDTVCVALGTCIITTMAIRSADMGINLNGTAIKVTKHMLSEPRRIGGIDIDLDLSRVEITEKDKELMEKIGNTCPVARSLHPDMKVTINYNWNS